ncbi:hypothetical protein [Microbacterium sp. RU33B]|uniref:hypothetical protein n=1 Tax=Microbacterium sp. RU33B TaxID=1907390 RepID=UPI000963D5E3|nr:hypothetical protein [Microbacterium sp. RU33B]SIT72614.1 hypothetical protein SAMN05880545_1081 [Microbacterium sp. RU33B]
MEQWQRFYLMQAALDQQKRDISNRAVEAWNSFDLAFRLTHRLRHDRLTEEIPLWQRDSQIRLVHELRTMAAQVAASDEVEAMLLEATAAQVLGSQPWSRGPDQLRAFVRDWVRERANRQAVARTVTAAEVEEILKKLRSMGEPVASMTKPPTPPGDSTV